jgi:predicted  nucleic acid-binding Zn-ribbon protein
MTAFDEHQLRKEIARLHQEIAQRDAEIEVLNRQVASLEATCEGLLDLILPHPAAPMQERAEQTAEYGPIMRLTRS